MTIANFFKQIKTVLADWKRQSHTRHLTFAQRIRDRVRTLVVEALGQSCPAQVTEAYTAFNAAVDHEDDTFKIITKSPYTEEIQTADTTRDNTWSGIMNFIDFMKRLGSELQKAAAKRVSEMAEQYKIKNNARYEDQNTLTMQFIQQCEGVLAADIQTLGMGEYIAQLKQQTQVVIDLIGQRNQEMAGIDTRAMTPAREAVENAYVKLIGILNAHAITECTGGSSPYDQAIDVINTDIDYYVSKVFTKSSSSSGGSGSSDNGNGTSGENGNSGDSGNSGETGDDDGPSGGSGDTSGDDGPSGGSGDTSGDDGPSGGSGDTSGDDGPSGGSGDTSGDDGPSGGSGDTSGE